ncbi:hypothetical protein B296_00001091 [Ensete ventricosum]|uniref:Pectinesterase inhibitor domain-containing protein n=1 Tax=Ensete ventricosum TaxID=4639 RepID=A0A426ZSF9_ENSVE|nr:hypothetical protein B296_00001091 [Ensete ventricosum]
MHLNWAFWLLREVNAVIKLRLRVLFAAYSSSLAPFVVVASVAISQPATMMATHLFILFSLSSSLLPLAFATSSPGVHGPSKHDGDIVSICSHTDYVSLCFNAAHTYGHACAVIDAASLLDMHIHMARDHTQTVKNLASHLAANPSTSRSVKQALGICIKLYGDALDDLVKGSDAVKARDEGTANSMLSGVISYYSTCDDAFAEIPASNPLSKQDGTLMNIVSNALAIAHLILSIGP